LRGPPPTHLADEVVAESPALDAIVLGEGERALLHWKQGHRARARGDLREVLALAPGNPEAEELRAIWKG
jgi:hypothetical protein